MIKPNFPRAIFLAGLPRSGTTWTGLALAAAAHTTLIDEPFNYEFHKAAAPFNMTYIPSTVRNARFERQLRVVAKEDVYARFTAFLPYRINQSIPTARRHCEQVVIKDVHTLLALESIWNTIKPRIIVLLRHPGAVASSWKRLQLKGDFTPKNERLLRQKPLLDDYLVDFVRHLQPRDDFFFNVGSYWGAVYYVIHKMHERLLCGDCIFVTHEHLCMDPLKNFTTLCAAVGLPMSNRLINFLSRGDSRHESEKWRGVLSAEQLASVMEGAAPFKILERYYNT